MGNEKHIEKRKGLQCGSGVRCNYCRAQEKQSLHLGYASDEKPGKEIGRSMKRITIDINKKYFGVEHPLIDESILMISFCSCHHRILNPDKMD